MKTFALLVAASLFAVSAAYAQDTRPPVGSAPPPPGMNDPGVQPVAAASSNKTATPQENRSARALPSMHDDRAPDAKHLSIPQVSVRQDGKKQVQEYRRNGQLYRVVVTPEHGVPYSYRVDPDGTRHMDPGQPPVHPTMYKVLEWGKPARPAEAASSSPPADADSH